MVDSEKNRYGKKAVWVLAVLTTCASPQAFALEATTSGDYDAAQRQAALSSKVQASNMGVNIVTLRLNKMSECAALGLMYAPVRANGNGGCAPYPEPEQLCGCAGGGSTGGGGNGGGGGNEKNASYQVRDAAGKVSSYHGNKQAAEAAAKAAGGSISAKGSSYGSGYKENSSQSTRSATSKSGWSSSASSSSSSKSSSSSSKSGSSGGGKSSSGSSGKK